jgi:hypothetical protein
VTAGDLHPATGNLAGPCPQMDRPSILLEQLEFFPLLHSVQGADDKLGQTMATFKAIK